MLPKRRRLRAAEVREILRRGRSIRSGPYSVTYLSGPAAAAVVVSTKVAKTAVLRNRLRRRAYAVLGKVALPDVQAVFFVRSKEFEPAVFAALCSKLS